MSNTAQIVSAYDSVAAEYDGDLQPADWIRRALWRHFANVFRPGDRVLDAGSGTGLDTIHLASQGVRVAAVDASPGMLGQLREKLSELRLESLVEVHEGEVADVLCGLAGPFDGIVSSFAAMNTFHLPSFVPEAARLLRPRGRLIAHLLSPGHRFQSAPMRWWRVLRPNAASSEVDVHIRGELLVHTVLHEPELYRRFFAADFVRREAYPLGLLVGDRAERLLPRGLLDLMARLEKRAANGQRLTSAGRFYVLDLERRSNVHSGG